MPLHNDGLDTAQVVASGYTIAPALENPFQITRITGDITATAGQTLVIDAEITPTPEIVELIVEREDNRRVTKIPMIQTSPTRWAVTYRAIGPAIFQVVGRTGNLGVQSAPRRINITTLAVTGRVTGADGDILTRPPVPHVRVIAEGVSGTAPPAVTYPDGYYWIPLPAPGDYRLALLPQNHLLEEIAQQGGNDPPRVPGYADMFSNHVSSPDDAQPISVDEAGEHYDEILPKAGRIFGKITGRATSQISFSGNRVAFSSNRDGNDEIYVMASDGSGQTRLTTDPASDVWPSYSPDGSKIVFSSNRNGNANPEGDYELFVMNSDGTGLVQLTSNTEDDLFPAWSPDGTRIAFSRPDPSGSLDIWVIGADGAGETNLTASPGESEGHAAWSPDSTQIVFTKVTVFFQRSIWRIGADGTGAAQLSANQDQAPSYSPDGSKITFTSHRDSDDAEVYVMASDGTAQTRLTNSLGTDAVWRYALDGSKIVFVSNRHNPADPNLDLDVYVMEPDGQAQARLTTGASLTAPPSVGSGPDIDQPIALGGVGVNFYDQGSGKAIGLSTSTEADGNYEKWLPPGTYYGLVNRPSAEKPLGWNGYAPMWSRGQLFDNANGGSQSAIALASITSFERYNEELRPLFPVRGQVVPAGGPGLGDGGSVGSSQASSPFGRFWPIALPPDGEYTYPLPDGEWILVYSVPGYRTSYYHDTEDPAQATPVVVAGAGRVLHDQHINPE